MRAGWLSAAAIAFLACGAAVRAETHPILAIGSPAPDFALPGVDGQIHRLADYAASPVLAIVFTCNHCPIAQQYEQRIERLYLDYRDQGVAVVAIQPNAPEALRVDELDSSDLSDTLAEMKIRAAYKHLTYPYLYDGETQSVARAYGPQATPHVFIFDRDRRLRYEGRFDSSYREEMAKTHDARNAIDALLAGKPVEVTHTGVFGCSTKWKEKEAERLAALRKLEEQPVKLTPISAEDLKTLRANPARKLTLVRYWSVPAAAQFADIETIYRMYGVRGLELVTVATGARAEVQRTLEQQHATSRNLYLESPPDWDASQPYTVLMTPDQRVVYQKAGALDMLQLRRTILSHMDWEYEGFSRYWALP